LKNRLTRIGAEADPHSLIMAKERAKFMESPTIQAMPVEEALQHRLCQQREAQQQDPKRY